MDQPIRMNLPAVMAEQLKAMEQCYSRCKELANTIPREEHAMLNAHGVLDSLFCVITDHQAQLSLIRGLKAEEAGGLVDLATGRSTVRLRPGKAVVFGGRNHASTKQKASS